MLELIRKLRRLLTRREKLQAVLLLCGMLVAAVLEMVGVGAIPAFVSALTDPDAVREHPAGRSFMEILGLETTEELVLWGAGALLLLFIVKNAYLALMSWVQARYVFNRQVGIARRLFAAYLHTPYTFHLQRNSAELLRNTNQDAMQVVGAGLMPLLQLAMEALTVTAILILLLVAEPVISIASFVVLGGTTALFLRVVRTRMLRIGEEQRIHRRQMLQSVNEGLGGIKVTKVLGRQPHFLDTFDTAAAGFAVTGRIHRVLQEIPRLLLETVAVGGLLAVAVLLLAQGRPVASLVPALALLAVAIVRMIPSFNRITSALNALRFGRAALRGVYEDLVTLERRRTTPREPIPFEDRIRLEGVSLTYPGAEEPSLTDVTLEIPKGSAVGFVGPTGSGKTTIVDVVLGLLPPSTGRVLVDGRDLRGREGEWQRRIGYIPQDIYLTDASIRENIAFGLPEEEIEDEAVWRAVDAAQVREFVERLPAGLDTVVGERGVRLSGGQRQRIGIARALYHDPDVLVLDEATSALDHETERYVMDAIEHLRGRRTLLIVAHRLSTVEACDRLFSIRGGRLAAESASRPLATGRDDGEKILAGSPSGEGA